MIDGWSRRTLLLYALANLGLVAFVMALPALSALLR
jgi:hypothetical protein